MRRRRSRENDRLVTIGTSQSRQPADRMKYGGLIVPSDEIRPPSVLCRINLMNSHSLFFACQLRVRPLVWRATAQPYYALCKLPSEAYLEEIAITTSTSGASRSLGLRIPSRLVICPRGRGGPFSHWIRAGVLTSVACPTVELPRANLLSFMARGCLSAAYNGQRRTAQAGVEDRRPDCAGTLVC